MESGRTLEKRRVSEQKVGRGRDSCCLLHDTDNGLDGGYKYDEAQGRGWYSAGDPLPLEPDSACRLRAEIWVLSLTDAASAGSKAIARAIRNSSCATRAGNGG